MPISAAFSIDELPAVVRWNPMIYLLPWGQRKTGSLLGREDAVNWGIVTRAPWDSVLNETISIIIKDFENVEGPQPSVRKPRAALLQNCMPVRHFALDYYNAILGSQVDLVMLLGESGVPLDLIGSGEVDYFILEEPAFCSITPIEPPLMIESTYTKEIYDHIQNNKIEFESRYKIIAEIGTPRGTKIIIYGAINGNVQEKEAVIYENIPSV